MSWLLLLAVASALTSPNARECSLVEAAHGALLENSFTAERDFSLVINGELKARQTARLTYANGLLEREVMTQEQWDKNIVLDEDGELSALALPFDCTHLVRTTDGHYEMTSLDRTEKVLFELRDQETALRPLSWTNTETVRFLWKKLEIEAVASYRNFVWQ